MSVPASSESPVQQSAALAADLDDTPLPLPLLGKAPAHRHRRTLTILLVVMIAVLLGVSAFAIGRASQAAQQIAAIGQALMHSQRLDKSVALLLSNGDRSFGDVNESADMLGRIVRGLKSGDDDQRLRALGAPYQDDLDLVLSLTTRAEQSAKVLLSQRQILIQTHDVLRAMNQDSAELLEAARAVALLKLRQNAPSAEVSAARQLITLTLRIDRSSNELYPREGVNPEKLILIGKDLSLFQQIAHGLLDGDSDLHLTPTRDPATRERLEVLLKVFEQTQVQVSPVLDNAQDLAMARDAQNVIFSDSEPLRHNLELLQNRLSAQAGLGMVTLLSLLAAALLSLLCAAGLARVQLLDSRARQAAAERRQIEALRQSQNARRMNDATQAAILRLMNELKAVAKGDLTQQATVTEDLTGTIADSINYTVEELRALVGHVQDTAHRVAQTSAQVDGASTELLAASTEQLREIRETGQSVLAMAARINGMSGQAQESVAVARQSLQAAESGLHAVQDAIGGMNIIRDQIQDTSKRIKRLGESSQQISEITGLISDITEQTNVLALNAAIQAVSAGEAGRGFSVVAEEVQRLAERSADATRQIAALVKTIQLDTQDAVAAMERSTRGAVEGARLSGSAGTALSEIDRVSRHLADLIEQISGAALHEAELANGVADNIQHIFAVAEQTGDGTRATVQAVRALASMAEELRQSVARFKIKSEEDN